MNFDILTIFPNLLESPLNEGILRRAREKGSIKVNVTDIRDFAEDRHSMTDDRPFGGGEGMVMKAEPLSAAIKALDPDYDKERVILLSPQGQTYNQEMAQSLAQEDRLILICGRYEGVDERFRKKYVTDEISIGDFILTGGELGAMILIDSITRLLPGVLGCSASAENDTFSRKLLKHPQYTRPRVFEEMEVPEELLSGDHKKIEDFRFIASVRRTIQRRPELVTQEKFDKGELKLLKKYGLYKSILQLKKDPGRE